MFFPPENYLYCRVVVALGLAIDLLFAQPKYTTDWDCTNCYTLSLQTGWFPAVAGLPAKTISLASPTCHPRKPLPSCSLGMQLGVPGLTGGIEHVRLRVGSAKILAAV